MLSDMSRTLDAINAQKVDTQLLSRQRMPHSRALVKDKAVGGLKFPDNGTGVVASSLDDLNTLVDDHLRKGVVVRGDDGWEQGDVDAKRLLGHRTGTLDLLAEGLGGGLGECREETESTSVGDCGYHFGVANPLHAALDDGDWEG